MNIYKPTGKRLESFPQWVDRLIKENEKLLEKIKEYEDRDRIMRGTGDGQEASAKDQGECPFCDFVDKKGEHDSVHEGWGACPEE